MNKFSIVLLLGAISCSAEVTGVLSVGNILNWDLTVTDPTQTQTSFNILGPLSGNNSQVGLFGSDLTASASDLTFNFSGGDGGYLLFQNPFLFSGADFWCNSTIGFPAGGCSDNPSVGESLATNGQTEDGPVLSGPVVIASGGTTVGSDTTYNVSQSWTTSNNQFTVTGTIEIGPVVPEPSMLGFLGLGVAFMGFWKIRASRSS
jgi:hypothetical protein